MIIRKFSRYLLAAGVAIIAIILFSSCAFRSIKRSKGIVYLAADSLAHIAAQKLNVFAPRKPDPVKNVLIFIHGGNWNAGRRSLYNFFGSRMARKGIVTVVIDYPLSPVATYKEMAKASAASVKWVKDNIEKYGGDPEKIFISGHSAGGHLAALIALDNQFSNDLHIANPVKGTILIDAAGLDMYTYLKQESLPEDDTYLKTFTTDPAEWKKASPLYYLHKKMPPFLIFQGEKTYPSIKETNETFINKLSPIAPSTKYLIIKGKKHVGMITQFFNPWNDRYKEIKAFMNSIK